MGVEPTTYALRVRCSASELHRHIWFYCINYYSKENREKQPELVSGPNPRS